VSEVGLDFWSIIGFKILQRHSTSMESQQIVELLLSMQAKMDTNQERTETNRRADHEEMMAMLDA
jgi:hypothetical protein